MTRALAVVAVALLVAAVGFGVAVYRDGVRHAGRILPGVTINGIAVGGLRPEQARGRVEGVIAEHLGRTLGIRAGGPIVRPTLADLGVRAEYGEAVNTAYALGREPRLLDRLRTRWRLRRGIDVPLRFVQDEGALRRVVTRLAQAVAVEPRDAAVTVVEDAVVLTQASVDGRMLRVDETITRVRAALGAGAAEVEAAVTLRRPRFTTEAAQSITTVVGRYSTRFVNIPNRNHNIALAASRLRGMLILPEEEFSFNQTVGPRSPELGYLPAPVLLNNILVPGDGGGVCQVSSTLFNTVLLADLPILARTNHSRPVPYLPMGRDATVVYGGQDLRFRNSTGVPLLLWSQVRGRRLTITLYGPAAAVRQVRIIVTDFEEIPAPTRTVTREDPELPVGQTVIDPPKPGYRVRTYRVVEQDGVELKRELIGRSVYTPLPLTIRVGAQQAARAPVVAP